VAGSSGSQWVSTTVSARASTAANPASRNRRTRPRASTGCVTQPRAASTSRVPTDGSGWSTARVPQSVSVTASRPSPLVTRCSSARAEAGSGVHCSTRSTCTTVAAPSRTGRCSMAGRTRPVRKRTSAWQQAVRSTVAPALERAPRSRTAPDIEHESPGPAACSSPSRPRTAPGVRGAIAAPAARRRRRRREHRLRTTAGRRARAHTEPGARHRVGSTTPGAAHGRASIASSRRVASLLPPATRAAGPASPARSGGWCRREQQVGGRHGSGGSRRWWARPRTRSARPGPRHPVRRLFRYRMQHPLPIAVGSTGRARGVHDVLGLATGQLPAPGIIEVQRPSASAGTRVWTAEAGLMPTPLGWIAGQTSTIAGHVGRAAAAHARPAMAAITLYISNGRFQLGLGVSARSGRRVRPPVGQSWPAPGVRRDRGRVLA
jgi:hypothetical protein